MADKPEDTQGQDHPEDCQKEDHREDHREEEYLEDLQMEDPRRDRRERTSRRAPGGLMSYVKGKIQVLERKVQMNKTKTNKSATVAAKVQMEQDIAKREAKELSGVVTQLQRRPDRPEGVRRAGSDRPPLELGSSDDGWGPGPNPRRPRAPGGVPCSHHMPSRRGSRRGSVMSG